MIVTRDDHGLSSSSSSSSSSSAAAEVAGVDSELGIDTAVSDAAGVDGPPMQHYDAAIDLMLCKLTELERRITAVGQV